MLIAILSILFVVPLLQGIQSDSIIWYAAAEKIVTDITILFREPILFNFTVGLPLLIVPLFFFFGISQTVALVMPVIFYTFLCVFLYLFVRWITKEDDFSFFVSLFFLFQRNILASSTYLTTVVPTMFFLLLSVYAFVNVLEKKELKYYLLFFASFAFASITRITVLVLIPTFILYVLINKKLRLFINKKALIGVFVFLLIWTPQLLYNYFIFGTPILNIYDYYFTNTWELEGFVYNYERENSGLSYLNIGKNLNIILGEFFNQRIMPFLLTLFCIPGFVYLYHKKKRVYSLFLMWFLSFFALHMVYQSYSFNHHNLYIGFTLIISSVIGFSIFLKSVFAYLKKKFNNLSVLFLIPILLLFVPYFFSSVNYRYDSKLIYLDLMSSFEHINSIVINDTLIINELVNFQTQHHYVSEENPNLNIDFESLGKDNFLLLNLMLNHSKTFIIMPNDLEHPHLSFLETLSSFKIVNESFFTNWRVLIFEKNSSYENLLFLDDSVKLTYSSRHPDYHWIYNESVIDSSNETFWIFGDGFPQWLEIDFGDKKNISLIKISSYPEDYLISGSVLCYKDEDWYSLFEFENNNKSVISIPREILVDKIKIIINESYGDNFASINEILMI